MPDPTVSVLIPAYNAGSLVGRAIESALGQSYPPLEVIVVDDGSTDETSAVAARYEPQVRLLRQPNAGPASARNLAASVSSGDWLALLDHDDTWLPHRLEKQLPYTAKPRVGLIHARGAEFSVRRMPARVSFATLWQRNWILASSTLIRRAAFDEVGGFDPDPALIGVEDYNLWLRLVAAGWEIATCPEQLSLYTPAPGNLSSDHARMSQAEMANLLKLGEQLGLDRSLVREKLILHARAYGRGFIHLRQMQQARRLLVPLLRKEPSLSTLGWLLATFIPTWLLDCRRRFTSPGAFSSLVRDAGGRGNGAGPGKAA